MTEKDHLTAALGREAAAFVTTHKEKPWFLDLAFNAPHTPLQPAPRDLKPVAGIPEKRRRDYAGLVVGMDQAIGRVLTALRESGREENTLVFFFSDNGGPEKVNASDNGVFRGGKGEVFEGGIRVPFLISWPAKLKPAASDIPVHTLDVFATSCGVAGLPPAGKLDGMDLIPFLTGSRTDIPERMLFWRTGGRDGSLAVRSGSWKWVRSGGSELLFDLDSDPGETSDASARNPERATALKESATGWSGMMAEPKWPGLKDAARRAAKK